MKSKKNVVLVCFARLLVALRSLNLTVRCTAKPATLMNIEMMYANSAIFNMT